MEQFKGRLIKKVCEIREDEKRDFLPKVWKAAGRKEKVKGIEEE